VLSSRDAAVRFRVAAVAGAEHRLVLRVVSPAGAEDKANDELLPIEALDNLRVVFKRLPDGHYRIYKIQPDGIERLVVDVFVRQGRAMDIADETTDAGDLPVEPAIIEPPAVEPADAEAPLPDPEAALPANDASGAIEADAAADDESAIKAAIASGGGTLLYSLPPRRAARIARGPRRAAGKSFSKVSRMLRRKR
jgi:hypothetical protein